jgi:hypothetical protein
MHFDNDFPLKTNGNWHGAPSEFPPVVNTPLSNRNKHFFLPFYSHVIEKNGLIQ